jgi:hypothetical protein
VDIGSRFEEQRDSGVAEGKSAVSISPVRRLANDRNRAEKRAVASRAMTATLEETNMFPRAIGESELQQVAQQINRIRSGGHSRRRFGFRRPPHAISRKNTENGADLCGAMGDYGSKLYDEPSSHIRFFFRQNSVGTQMSTTNMVADQNKGDAPRGAPDKRLAQSSRECYVYPMEVV